jgi:hypothetical protein
VGFVAPVDARATSINDSKASLSAASVENLLANPENFPLILSSYFVSHHSLPTSNPAKHKNSMA